MGFSVSLEVLGERGVRGVRGVRGDRLLLLDAVGE